MKKPIYLGVFLTEQAKRQLLQKFPPLYDTVHNDHVTLVYKPSAEQIESFVPGERVTIRVIGYAEDEKGQAVTVSLPSGYKKDSGVAHVTLTTAPGVPPVYSNELVHKAKPVTPFTVEGVTDYFPRTNMKKAREIEVIDGVAYDDEGNATETDAPDGYYPGSSFRRWQSPRSTYYYSQPRKTTPKPAPAPKPAAKPKIEVLEKALGKKENSFLRSILDQLLKGRTLSDAQLKVVRQNLYKLNMKSEADQFREASVIRVAHAYLQKMKG